MPTVNKLITLGSIELIVTGIYDYSDHPTGSPSSFDLDKIALVAPGKHHDVDVTELLEGLYIRHVTTSTDGQQEWFEHFRDFLSDRVLEELHHEGYN